MSYDNSPGGVPLRIDLSPMSHPSMVIGEGPGASTARSGMAALYTAHGQILDLGTTIKDKTAIPQAAIPHAEKAVSKAGAAQEVLTAQIVHLAAEIATTIKGQPTAAAAEIRSFWAKQKSTTKLALMFHRAAENPDTVAAILGGPAYLSGLKDDTFLMLKDQAAQSLAPEQHAMIAETRAALGILDKAVESFTEKTTALLSKWQSKDAEIIEKTLNPKEAE